MLIQFKGHFKKRFVFSINFLHYSTKQKKKKTVWPFQPHCPFHFDLSQNLVNHKGNPNYKTWNKSSFRQYWESCLSLSTICSSFPDQ